MNDVQGDGGRSRLATALGSLRSAVAAATTGTAACGGAVALAVALAAQAVALPAAEGRTVYVSNARNSLRAIDTGTNAFKGGPIDVGYIPERITISRDGLRIYVPDSGLERLVVIDTATDQAIARIYTGLDPRDVAVTPDGAFAYVANYSSGTVAVVDTATFAVAATIPVGWAPRHIAMTPDGSRAYVTNEWGGTVVAIDTASRKVMATLNLSTWPDGIAVAPDGSRVYVLHAGGGPNVTIIDNTGVPTVVAKVGDMGNAAGISLSPDSPRFAYVTNSGSDSVSMISTATDEVVATIPVGNEPFELAASPGGDRVYVGNHGATTLSVIDTAERRVIDTVELGKAPNTLVMTPDGGRVYVTISGVFDNVKVVDTATNRDTATLSMGSGAGADINVVPNQTPTARLAVEPGAAGAETVFDASASSDPDGRVSRYDYNFGDRTSATVAEPVTAHTYADPGEYTVRLRVTDDEGGSASLVTDGETVFHSVAGQADAEATFAVPPADAGAGPEEPDGDAGSGEPGADVSGGDVAPRTSCAFSLGAPVASVSHWRALGALRARLQVEPGGYVLRGAARDALRLRLRATASGRASLDSARLYVDGRLLKTDRSPPYSVAVAPGALSTGVHSFSATVVPDRGARRSLTLRFHVSDCEADALSASLSSKVPSAHPDLELRARSGQGALRSVEFRLSRALELHAGRLRGTIGRLAVSAADGKVAHTTLRAGAGAARAWRAGTGAAGEVMLAARRGVKARLARRGGRRVLRVEGLDRHAAVAVRVVLDGNRTGLLENPPGCDRRHRFAATVTTAAGRISTLERTLVMCKA